MTKATRALSGKAKDVFLEGVVRSALADDPVARDRLLKELTEAIAGLRVRVDAERGRHAITNWTSRILAADPQASAPAAVATPAADAVHQADPAPETAWRSKATGTTPTASRSAEPPSDDAAFDPYTPNVIVILRTKGRDAALAALAMIKHEAQLRMLAHEQQLGLPPDASAPAQIREAIVAAAERRVANRQAAGR